VASAIDPAGGGGGLPRSSTAGGPRPRRRINNQQSTNNNNQQSTINNVQCTMYNVQCTMYICTMCIAHVQCTLFQHQQCAVRSACQCQQQPLPFAFTRHRASAKSPFLVLVLALVVKTLDAVQPRPVKQRAPTKLQLAVLLAWLEPRVTTRIGMNSLVVLYNPEARQSLRVIYSRERRSAGSPLSCEGQGPVCWKVNA
jgi:hypothetical protein